MKHPELPVVMKNTLIIVKPHQMEVDHPDYEIAFVIETRRQLMKFYTKLEDVDNGDYELTISAAKGRKPGEDHIHTVGFKGPGYSLFVAMGGFNVASLPTAEEIYEGVYLIGQAGFDRLKAKCYLSPLPADCVIEEQVSTSKPQSSARPS